MTEPALMSAPKMKAPPPNGRFSEVGQLARWMVNRQSMISSATAQQSSHTGTRP
jgi:hypothetical protein